MFKMILNSILSTIHFIIRYTGAAYLIRRFFARKSITIIMYHNPEENVFRTHVEFLSKRYRFITLSDLIDFYYSPMKPGLPEYALLVTFDDGWKENCRLLDIIREYNIRPLIFLSSHLADTSRHFWFTACSDSETETLKNMPSDQRILWLKEIYGYYPEKEFPEKRQALNIDEINRVKEYVDFGSHTSFHTVLTKCDPEGKAAEIIGSVEKLEELLDREVSSFAYPNGDYDGESIELLKQCNIKIARTIDAGWNNRRTDPYRLKVTGASDDATVTKLASEMTGISRYMQYFLKGSFNGLKPRI